MADLLDLSADFDLGDRVYLDGANHGPMARRALAAAREALDWKRDPAGLDDRLYFELPDRIRRSAASLFGCEPRDVAIANGASHGISLVAQGLDWRDRDRVVIPTGEFPANSLPWLSLRRRGVQVDVVSPDRIVESIGSGTRVVSVGHVNYASGRRLDLEAIGSACTSAGAILVVDVAQSLGALPVDVRRWGAAVVAGAGYKWLMSPYGTGVTYVHPDWVDRLPVSTFNWASIEGADDFNRLADLDPVFREGACRFDVPETAAFIHGAAMAESLALLEEVGVASAWAHSSALLDRLIDRLPAGFQVDSDLTPRRRSTILRLIGSDPEAARRAHAFLKKNRVAVSLREGGLRVAPGIWNTAADIDRLVDVLAQAR